MTSKSLKIDTPGMCLWCLKDIQCEGKVLQDCQTGFKMLLRCLEIDISSLVKFSGYCPSRSTNIDSFSVTLCAACSSTTNKTWEVFRTGDKMRLELEHCVKQIQELGKCDDEKARLEVLDKRMTEKGQDMDLYVFNTMKTLRQAIKEACHLKVKKSVPRVVLKREGASTSGEFEALGLSWDGDNPLPKKLRNWLLEKQSCQGMKLDLFFADEDNDSNDNYENKLALQTLLRADKRLGLSNLSSPNSTASTLPLHDSLQNDSNLSPPSSQSSLVDSPRPQSTLSSILESLVDFPNLSQLLPIDSSLPEIDLNLLDFDVPLKSVNDVPLRGIFNE